MLTVYGINTCDTVRKARKWLDKQSINYQYYDLKKGIETEQVERWLEKIGAEQLINKRGTTWRNLPEQQRADLTHAQLVELIINNPSIIKRPLLESDAQLDGTAVPANLCQVGFTEKAFTELFQGEH